ncbi:MAG: Ig-like domain-containing protein [Gemmatimonadota bacterium]
MTRARALPTLATALALGLSTPVTLSAQDSPSSGPAIAVSSGDTLSLDPRTFGSETGTWEGLQLFPTPFSLGQFLDGGRFVGGLPAEGVITSVREGEVVAQVMVTVTPPPAASVEVGTLPEWLVAGSVVPLSATARDRSGRALDAEVEDFAWSTSDPSVATVDPLGNLVARGPGRVTVTASHRSAATALGTERTATTGASGTRTVEVVAAPGGELAIEGPEDLRTGDVGHLGVGIEGAHPRWFVTPEGARIGPDGAFVASRPGTYLVEAILGDRTARHAITVAPRAVRRQLRVVGRGPVTERLTGDLRVFTGLNGRDYAYLGTAESNAILIYDVTDPTSPVLTDSVTTDARFVLDVKVNGDASLAVFSREGAATRANGIVILDLADPAHPEVLSEFTETVPGGVHNTFFDGDHVYATHDGDGSLHIIDVSDPRNPREAGEWHTDTPGRYLHDMFVEDGIAYLAYWQDGLVILDVGGGGEGGSPSNPVKIGQLVYDAAEIYGPGGGGPRGTHSVYVEDGIAYVGDEVYPPVFDLTQPIFPRGYIHVVDVSDPTHPREIARYEVPEAGAHNHWVEDGRLYSAYYQAGVRVVDVSGETRGNLYDQGREVAAFVTDAADQAYLPHRAFAFGAQLFKDRIYVSDMSSGLWVLELTGEPRAQYPAE